MKCFRLRCCVNNSFLVFHQGTKHSKTIKHSRFALVFHTVFSCLDPLMKHSNSLFTYNVIMSVPRGFLLFHPASKLLQNFLNLLTRRSYASSSVWSNFTIASSFIVLAGYILCTNYYPLPILFGLLNASKHSSSVNPP